MPSQHLAAAVGLAIGVAATSLPGLLRRLSRRNGDARLSRGELVPPQPTGEAEAADLEWTTSAWLTSLPQLVDALADALLRPLPHGACSSSAAQLAHLRAIGSNAQGGREALAALLRGDGLPDGPNALIDALANSLWPALHTLATAQAVTATELHERYVQAREGFELQYGSLHSFYGGMQAIVGPPHPRVREQMEREHVEMVDSDEPFTAGNYGVTTTSRTEFWFVADPDRGLRELGLVEYPSEDASKLTGRARPRVSRPLSSFGDEVLERNGLLTAERQAPLEELELLAARLYTGPTFVKYNAVLQCRQLPHMPEHIAAIYRACHGNVYATTLHAINSAIVKLGKLTIATIVWRGVSGGLLPDRFRSSNAFGVKGGIEAGFMSTTTDREVAMSYATTRGGPAVVFEVQQGMVDRGTDLSWLSQCAPFFTLQPQRR